MTMLVRYDAARAALQAAQSVDEVKDIRDKAQAMAAYARQAKDTELVEWATEIKVRAERRAGEMLAETVTAGNPQFRPDDGIGRIPEGISENQSRRWQTIAKLAETVHHEGGRPKQSHDGTVLPEGVSKNQSSRWQMIAKLAGGLVQAGRELGPFAREAAMPAARAVGRTAAEMGQVARQAAVAPLTGLAGEARGRGVMAANIKAAQALRVGDKVMVTPKGETTAISAWGGPMHRAGPRQGPRRAILVGVRDSGIMAARGRRRPDRHHQGPGGVRATSFKR